MYANTNTRLYGIDASTLAPALVAELCTNVSGVSIGDIAFSTDETLYAMGLADTGFFRIDAASGDCTRIRNLPERMFGATFVPPGVLGPSETLTAASDQGNFYTIDLDGMPHLVGALGAMPSGDLEWTGTQLLLTVEGPAADRIVAVSLATGQTTDIGSVGQAGVQGLAWLDGILYGFTGAGDIVQIDPATGGTGPRMTTSLPWTGAAIGP